VFNRRRLIAFALGVAAVCAIAIAVAGAIGQDASSGGFVLLPDQSAGPETPSIDGFSDTKTDLPAGANWLPCTRFSEPLNFPDFSVGSEFLGIRLSTVQRLCLTYSAPNTIRPNFMNYMYGDCELAPAKGEKYVEGGCAPPLQIHSYPACERSLADYQVDENTPYPHAEPQTLPGGAIQVSFDGGTRVEIYTGQSTIVIFGDDPELVARAAQSVRRDQPAPAVGTPTTSDETAAEFPPPAEGAISGDLQCSA
jgi:hypothetical protein